ncbi:hypothetical protein O181_123959 [Austropuccinia psidii MF-1]|uniref:Uncharacterized protein n=1 Tax=Austropuccinia psidii MF-1 TaxID=1389203 RepID=A0A9Q3KR44_9BASI|nr:hypothetical protein [Austropuccinia psidii MF-1]
MAFKRQSNFSFSSLSHLSSRNNTDFFPLLIEQKPLNPLQQDSPVPSLPCKQTSQQPTPGPSGTRWSEELFREPFQTKEPPIPGPILSSQPPGTIRLLSQNLRWLLHNQRRNILVSPNFTFLTLLKFSSPLLQPSPAFPATPCSIININDMPVGSPLPLLLP